MNIIWHENTRQIHLYNQNISYIMSVQPNGELGQVYFGKKLHDRDDFSHLIHYGFKSHVSVDPGDENFSMELNLQEYPSFGGTDFGTPAYEITYANGSAISSFVYASHEIFSGKKPLAGLPATYATNEEAMTVEVTLKNTLTDVQLILSYSIYEEYPAIIRSARFVNNSEEEIRLERALSLCLDMPDSDYEWIQFSGAWVRERIPVKRKIDIGCTSIESKRGVSSANHNPFVILKRPNTDEFSGEAIGFSFIYSGNFIATADADTYGRLRFVMGIHPDRFSWPLAKGEEFVTPEVVMSYSDAGLNKLSQSYHRLFNNHLIRGAWKKRPKPILLNNWEATFMDFTEESILKIASKAKEAGAELFVLDDGWFGKRDDDTSGLGDWFENTAKLPQGIRGLADKINDMGLKFGFWIEPEMVNPDSDLYRAHPDWAFAIPGKAPSLCRHQLVLDYSRPEVVDYIYDMLYKVIDGAKVSYIKWDMNRSITECFSNGCSPEEQGMVYHKYVLGVYSLYERLIKAFPDILFESCASGGARFDAGMLHYAPQAWCSDNTDAADRVKIQMGTSYGYPISSIGSHVSAVPNQQTGRTIPIDFRANVAYFGTFGYELDLNHIPEDEFALVKEQVKFMKENRELIQYGDFYRLSTPFPKDISAWSVVSEDKSRAVLGCYVLRSNVNDGKRRLKLAGLDPDRLYHLGDCEYYGDELMNIGLVLDERIAPEFNIGCDYRSFVVVLH